MDVEKVEQALTAPRAKRAVAIPSKDLLGSGCTLLNLAASDRIAGTFAKGTYSFYVGDSSSGKTFLALTSLAEACANKHFDDYRIIYDNAENGALMDIEKFFGKRVVDRLEPPSRDDEGKPVYSRYVEQFYYHLDTALKGKKPCIYIEDSMDSLNTKYAEKKFEEAKDAFDEDKTAKGSYGDGKAKINSENIRHIGAKLRDTGSILIIICQTRDNIDAGMFEPQQTYAGGRAVKFYAACEIWTSVARRLTKSVRGKDRQIGIVARVKIKKNRITGKERTIEVPLHWSTGIDDVGGCVDYLLEEKHWKKNKEGYITAKEISVEMRREELIQYIEEQGLEMDLRNIVAGVWADIEEECEVKRKPRYT